MGIEFALPRGFVQVVLEKTTGAVQLFPPNTVPADADIALLQLANGSIAWRDDPKAKDELVSGIGMIWSAENDDWFGVAGEYTAPFDVLYVTYVQGDPVIRALFYRRTS